MSRIFPQNYKDLNSLNYSRVSYKKTWGYGEVNPKIGYYEFIDTLDDLVDDDFLIWIQRHPFLFNEDESFVDIIVINPSNGVVNLIEYFPFNKNIIKSKKANNRIECFRNFDLQENLKEVKINDYPCDRLKKFSKIISQECYNNSVNDFNLFVNNHIKKYFFFGSMNKIDGK